MAFSCEKTFNQSKYLVGTSKWALSSFIMATYIKLPLIIWIVFEGRIVISANGVFSAAMGTTKVLKSSSNTVWANFFFSMSSTHLVVGKTLAVVENFWVSFFFANWISALLKVMKNIPRTMSILILANKKVSWKNWAFSSLFFT